MSSRAGSATRATTARRARKGPRPRRAQPASSRRSRRTSAGEKPLAGAGRRASATSAMRVAFFVDTHKQKIVLVGADEAWKVAALLAEKKVPVILGPTQALPAVRRRPVRRDDGGAGGAAQGGRDRSRCRPTARRTRATCPTRSARPSASACRATSRCGRSRWRPAQILGLDALVGSIEPGKIANLVVSRGDPLEIRTEITHVFVKGVPVSLTVAPHRAVREVPEPAEAGGRHEVATRQGPLSQRGPRPRRPPRASRPGRRSTSFRP